MQYVSRTARTAGDVAGAGTGTDGVWRAEVWTLERATAIQPLMNSATFDARPTRERRFNFCRFAVPQNLLWPSTPREPAPFGL